MDCPAHTYFEVRDLPAWSAVIEIMEETSVLAVNKYDEY